MNKYLFLPFQSTHLLSVFKAWITCYIQRIRVLCSIDEMFETHKEKFRNRLRRRGYPIKFLDQIFGEQHSRNILLLKQQTRTKRNNKSNNVAYKAAFILPLCEYTERIKQPIKKCLRITTAFQQDPHFKDIFGNRNTPMIIYETTTIISGLLIRSTIPIK
jgi:plasmid rolling circle replication initiator protein Rep